MRSAQGSSVMTSLAFRVRNRVLRQVPPRVLPVHGRPDLERLGSEGYGGFIVAANLLSQESICWCAGVGEEITFDLALIQRFGCQVWGLDPTPRAIRHVKIHASHEPRYHFLPVGLWSEDVTLSFFAPQNPSHVSYSIVNLQGTQESFDAPCRSVRSLMNELGQNRIDLLKLNIEGAAYAVLESMARDDIRPRQLCISFDQPTPLRKVLNACRRLLAGGYKLVAIDGWNFTFVLD